MRLDLFGIHVLAIRKDDDIFTASCNYQISVRLDESKIARVQPSVFDDFGSFPVVVVIALHQDRTTNPHLADSFVIRRIDADRHSAKRLSNCTDTIRSHGSDCRGR